MTFARDGSPMSTSDILPFASAPPPASPPYAFFRLPIVFGPLRGYGWLPASGGKLLRILLGTYEREQTNLFQELVGPGSYVLDVGAAHGYYTLLAGHLAGPTGQVISFEPDRENAAFLREHVTVNSLDHVSIHEWAIGDCEGRMRFGAGTGTGTGRFCESGDKEVRVRRLDDIFADDSFLPNHIKIDVEGAEVAVLRGGSRLIKKTMPTIFLSTHGAEVHAECCRLLTNWGYTLAPIVGDDIATTSEILAQAD